MCLRGADVVVVVVEVVVDVVGRGRALMSLTGSINKGMTFFTRSVVDASVVVVVVGGLQNANTQGYREKQFNITISITGHM